jgi:hypothetical protein
MLRHDPLLDRSDHAHLADANAFAKFLAPLRKRRWFVYAKRPFAGPKAVPSATASAESCSN